MLSIAFIILLFLFLFFFPFCLSTQPMIPNTCAIRIKAEYRIRVASISFTMPYFFWPLQILPVLIIIIIAKCLNHGKSMPPL